MALKTNHQSFVCHICGKRKNKEKERILQGVSEVFAKCYKCKSVMQEKDNTFELMDIIQREVNSIDVEDIIRLAEVIYKSGFIKHKYIYR